MKGAIQMENDKQSEFLAAHEDVVKKFLKSSLPTNTYTTLQSFLRFSATAQE